MDPQRHGENRAVPDRQYALMGRDWGACRRWEDRWCWKAQGYHRVRQLLSLDQADQVLLEHHGSHVWGGQITVPQVRLGPISFAIRAKQFTLQALYMLLRGPRWQQTTRGAYLLLYDWSTWLQHRGDHGKEALDCNPVLRQHWEQMSFN